MNIEKPILGIRDDKPDDGQEIPPAVVEAIMDDPAKMQPAARVMAVQMLYEEYVARGQMTAPQRLALAETLMRAGRIDGKAQDQPGAGQGPNQGYQLVINFNGRPSEEFRGITLEQAPAEGAIE